eukprot:CAMPEP_0194380768 /NCGR_PEP_ID=MMETSP0174-20130528/47590_1 /TAXON_ID=216777 /ORGANISM="Proboscia alata, Strain PI-D3" /LENGTH=898 /DNA_ID=CAMNT_0039164449 /DNA_START=24 /DNA_END=2717 /DNA_ORIENTATION=+
MAKASIKKKTIPQIKKPLGRLFPFSAKSFIKSSSLDDNSGRDESYASDSVSVVSFGTSSEKDPQATEQNILVSTLALPILVGIKDHQNGGKIKNTFTNEHHDYNNSNNDNNILSVVTPDRSVMNNIIMEKSVECNNNYQEEEGEELPSQSFSSQLQQQQSPRLPPHLPFQSPPQSPPLYHRSNTTTVIARRQSSYNSSSSFGNINSRNESSSNNTGSMKINNSSSSTHRRRRTNNNNLENKNSLYGYSPNSSVHSRRSRESHRANEQNTRTNNSLLHSSLSSNNNNVSSPPKFREIVSSTDDNNNMIVSKDNNREVFIGSSLGSTGGDSSAESSFSGASHRGLGKYREVLILLLSHQTKRFELIVVPYHKHKIVPTTADKDGSTSTHVVQTSTPFLVQDLLNRIDDTVTDEELSRQTYIGLCFPADEYANAADATSSPLPSVIVMDNQSSLSDYGLHVADVLVAIPAPAEVSLVSQCVEGGKKQKGDCDAVSCSKHAREILSNTNVAQFVENRIDSMKLRARRVSRRSKNSSRSRSSSRSSRASSIMSSNSSIKSSSSYDQLLDEEQKEMEEFHRRQLNQEEDLQQQSVVREGHGREEDYNNHDDDHSASPSPVPQSLQQYREVSAEMLRDADSVSVTTNIFVVDGDDIDALKKHQEDGTPSNGTALDLQKLAQNRAINKEKKKKRNKTVDTIMDHFLSDIKLMILTLFTMFILVIKVTSFHHRISAPLKSGDVLFAGHWRSKCGVTGMIMPSFVTGCYHATTLQFTNDGVLRLYESSNPFLIKMRKLRPIWEMYNDDYGKKIQREKRMEGNGQWRVKQIHGFWNLFGRVRSWPPSYGSFLAVTEIDEKGRVYIKGKEAMLFPMENDLYSKGIGAAGPLFGHTVEVSPWPFAVVPPKW